MSISEAKWSVKLEMSGLVERFKQNSAGGKRPGLGVGFSGWMGRQISRNRVRRRTQRYRKELKSHGSSAAVDGNIVPEERIGGGWNLLPPPRGECGREGLEFVGR